MEQLTEDQRRILKEFPALEHIAHRVRMGNGQIVSAHFGDKGDGLELSLRFEFGAGGVNYSMITLKSIAEFLDVVGVSAYDIPTALLKLPGTYVRIEHMTQASWTPFFRVRHIVEPEKSFVFTYSADSLERHVRGERV